MAVPSSGQLSLFSIAKEIELNSYTSTIPYPTYSGIAPYATPISLTNMSTGAGGFAAINTDSSDRPDGSTPHQMSEFYGYDHDAAPAAVNYAVLGADDWNDGDIGTGTRDDFATTALESNSVYVPASPFNTTPGTVDTRMSWINTSPSPSYPTVVSDQVRFRNSTNPHGVYIRTTDYMTPGGVLYITNIPNTQCYAWRFRFFMNSTNNKDQNIDLSMNTTAHPTQPSITTNTYLYQIRDNAGSGTGAIYFYKRVSGTTTLLATSPTTSYTLGTTKDFVASWHRAGTGRALTYTHKLAVGPSTTPTYTMIDSYNKLSVDDTTHSSNYAWTFRAPKFMSTPTSTHYHAVDVFSVSIIDDPTFSP